VYKRQGLVLVVGVGVGVGCGEGEEGTEVDLSDVDAVVAGHLEALSEQGKVFHAKAVWQQPEREGRVEVEEVWLDVDNGRFRGERRIEQEGEETGFWLVVGADLVMTSYKSRSNSVSTQTWTPDEWAEGAEAGMDNFAYLGLEYIPILIGSDEKRVVGESTVEGQPVVSVEAKWSWEPGGEWPEGVTYALTVDLDRSTLLPVQVQSKVIEPEDEEQPYGPFKYEIVEYVSAEDLPADFFSPQAVEGFAVTLDEELAQAQAQAEAAGFVLYWLGQSYQAEGLPELYLQDLWVFQDASEASLNYAIHVADLVADLEMAYTLFIRQGPAAETEFGPLPVRVGSVSEEKEEVTVHDEEAVLYVSAEPPLPGVCVVEEEGIPCTPVVADVPAYHRLVLTLGDTTIQLEAMASVREGEDRNPFNNREALLAVAEALVPIPAQP